MHVDLKARLDRLQKSGIIIEPKVGMQSALYKYLRSLKSYRFFNFFKKFLFGQHIRIGTFSITIKSAEPALIDTDH